MGSHEIMVIITIFIFLLVFLILREFWCWYIKVNKVVDLSSKILKEQETTNELLRILIKNSSKD